MNGQENLIPFTELTEEEQRAIARKGGIASGEARREKKKMKEQAELLLSLPVKNQKIKALMRELGIDETEQTNQMAMIVSLLNKTITKGDVQAFNSLQATIDERPVQNIDGTINGEITINIE